MIVAAGTTVGSRGFSGRGVSVVIDNLAMGELVEPLGQYTGA
jgi:hypothetical protein